MTWRRMLVGFALLLLLLFAGAWHWLLHTEAGARWLWAQAQSASDDALRMNSINGDLGSGLTVRGVVFANESSTVELEELRFAANLDLLPFRLTVDSLSAHDIAVRLPASAEDAEPDTSAVSLEKLSLPIFINISDSLATDIAVTTAGSESPIEIRQIRFAGSWHHAFVVENIDIEWANSSAKFEGELHLQDPYDLRVDGRVENVSVPIETIKPLYPEPLDLNVQVSGDLTNLDLDVSADNIELWLRGNIASSGSVAGSSTWNLQLASSDLDVSGGGEFNRADVFSVTADLDLAKFRANPFLNNWPEEHSINGKLALALSEEQLIIKDSWLAVDATETTLEIDARVDLAKSTTAGDLRWSNLVWPASDGGASIVSDSGSISVSGSLDDWRVNGRVALQSESIPRGRFQIDGFGDRDRMQATIEESMVLGGNIAGSVSYTWRGDQAWSATLQTSGLQLTALNPRWPGNVSGSFDARGTQTPLVSDVALEDVSGDFLALPISADGRLVFAEHSFVAHKIRIRHGDNYVELDGDLRATDGIEFDASIDDVSLYLVDAKGATDLRGKLSLNPAQPFIEIAGTGADLEFGQFQAESIEIRNRAEEDCPISTEVVIPELLVGDNAFSDFAVKLCGDEKQQEIGFRTTYDVVDIHLNAVGGFDDFARPDIWRGELRQFAVALDGEPAATLTVPVELALSNRMAFLERACLSGESDMQLCTALDWAVDDHIEFSAEMSDVPLALVNQFIPTDLQFNQSASGQLQWSSSEEKGTNGKADVTLTAGSIISVANTDISIPTDPGKLFFEIVNGQTLAGNASLPMPGFGRVDASLSILDIRQGRDGAIEGSVDIELSDMTLIAAAVPIFDEADGQFRADIKLSGSLVEPRLVGDFSVANGSLAFSPLGIRLQQIDLESTFSEDGQMELSGTFESGDGQAEIFTRSDYASTGAKGFELELRGQDLALIDVPDIKARADLDLKVGYDYEQLRLGGNILIQHARVMASKLAVAQDTESEDVVIVAGELPVEDEVGSSDSDLQVSGSVAIELGNDVSMDLGLATANITGNTLFTWEDQLVPIADGSYDLTGAVQAFGQTLEITEGGLRFPKVPADNPFVRLRAEREIYGNTQVKTAGILVDGTIRQFSVEAYTRPSTTEERALTLLVTGSDFDFEQGVGAIDFGTYIAPRVFVSYGVGLFETENVIRVRYDLMRGLGVTASSGEKESGIDLSYRIER